MSDSINLEGVVSANWQDIVPDEVAPGIYERQLWTGENGSKASVYEFTPGAVFPGIDTHENGPEQIYVASGVFNDGETDHPAGTFIHQPKGTSHIPQSEHGCVVLVIFPEG